jgi:hypothetical protein
MYYLRISILYNIVYIKQYNPYILYRVTQYIRWTTIRRAQTLRPGET